MYLCPYHRTARDRKAIHISKDKLTWNTSGRRWDHTRELQSRIEKPYKPKYWVPFHDKSEMWFNIICMASKCPICLISTYIFLYHLPMLKVKVVQGSFPCASHVCLINITYDLLSTPHGVSGVMWLLPCSTCQSIRSKRSFGTWIMGCMAWPSHTKCY